MFKRFLPDDTNEIYCSDCVREGQKVKAVVLMSGVGGTDALCRDCYEAIWAWLTQCDHCMCWWECYETCCACGYAANI